ncbi:hypothetical protein GBAR_LOCUS26684, partial [Geodia barretti]
MNVNMWPGLPQEAEWESSEVGGEEREEGRMEEGVRGGGGVEGGYGEEGYVEVEEEEELGQGQGDGWEEHLIRQEAREGEGETWGDGNAREEEGLGRYTNEGWEERYVGEEGEEPLEITPAPLRQTADELGASQNSLNLTTQEEVEPVAVETEDDTQHLYAKIPEAHKAKKRLKMMKQAQKEERKARKQKLKMEE